MLNSIINRRTHPVNPISLILIILVVLLICGGGYHVGLIPGVWGGGLGFLILIIVLLALIGRI